MYNKKGWTKMASFAKTRCEHEADRVIFYDELIRLTEQEIDRLGEDPFIRPLKRVNYATMKVQEPPSCD